MSPPRPLPEAVRGCWYLLPGDSDVPPDPEDPHRVMAFEVDGTYTRYDIARGRKKEGECGEYTFDGNFLILRGRRTHTYRVRRPTYWHWQLEGKKKTHLLLRGLISLEVGDEQLPPEEQRDISLLPLRARVEADFEGQDVIYRLVYEHGERDRRILATFCADHRPDAPLWIGLSPLVVGLEPRTWERIIRESYLGMHLDKPKNVEEVVLHLFDSHQSRQFSY